MMQPTAPLSSIDVPETRARDFDPAWAEALAAMIAVQGLLHPVVVRPTGNARFVLVAGLHRLRALAQLGRLSIPIRVSTAESDEAARLEEVMENLGRQDLIALDRCHHLHVLKEVWLRLYPQAKAGKHENRGNQHVGGRSRNPASSRTDDDDTPEVFSFDKAVAEKVGLGVTQIKQAVRIWHYLSPESRRRLVGTDLARKQTELKALSEEKPAVQAKILDLILGEGPVENVTQALEWLEHGRLRDGQESRFHTFSQGFGKLEAHHLDTLLTVHEDRVLESLRRRGRI